MIKESNFEGGKIMANIIAIVWDFDKTLVDGYMQDPIFKHYQVDSVEFWTEVNDLPRKYMEEQGVLVNPDTVYLNQFIKYAKEGKFKGLTNERLKEFGKEQKFYSGIPEIFQKTKALIENNPIYKEYDIKVEHYVVSTGMTQIIKGSPIMEEVEHVWGCELIEGQDNDGDPCIAEIGYTIDNTSKTRALFEINKGVHSKDGHKGVKVNTKIPEEFRRVHFINMMYVADGPSDIPAFSLINKNGGATFAIYPKGNNDALKQVEQMRTEGRINMYAEADYTEGTTAYMWICNKITEFAERIRKEEKNKIAKYATVEGPKHLIE